jgi:hypothetical protein
MVSVPFTGAKAVNALMYLDYIALTAHGFD